MIGVAYEVSQKFLVNIFIKHTANAYIMLLVTEVLINKLFTSFEEMRITDGSLHLIDPDTRDRIWQVGNMGEISAHSIFTYDIK